MDSISVDDDVTLETPQNYSVDFLVVAGGGGGGNVLTRWWWWSWWL
jgi:hypothetical protein